MKTTLKQTRNTMAERNLLSKFFLLCLSLFLPSFVWANTSIDEIIDTAQSFLEQETQNYLSSSDIKGRFQVTINRLDKRLRMAACDQELEASIENPQQPIGRVTLRIRCDGSSPWSIFVPAQVNLYREVVVATRPIRRNNIIQARDITLAERDVGSLTQGYILELESIIGSQATRALQPDQVISPNQLRLPAAVKRGEHVVITASSGTINVRMSGEALSDGAIGEQIRVRNTRSKRIIRARVIAPGQVEAAM